MSRKKTIIAVAVVLAGAGAIAAISAPGPRGWDRSGQYGGHMQDGHDGLGRRGMFGRGVTKDDYDARTRERFARLDKNSDGVLDASEIEGAFTAGRQRMMERFRGQRAAGVGADDPIGQRLLQRFDTNRDGNVTKDEFLARVRKGFAELDLNNDGRFGDDDLPPMMRGQGMVQRLASGDGGNGMGRGARMGGGDRGGMMQLLRGAEVKDAAISLDAVLATATRRFDGLDRIKDGAIDRADLDAMRKDMVDYRVKRFVHAHGADKEGKVTREQFFARSGERFAELDADGDGRLGRSDGGRGWGRHGGQGGGFGGRGDGSPRGPMGGGQDAPPKQ